jgi:hypothetical protein
MAEKARVKVRESQQQPRVEQRSNLPNGDRP